MPTNRTEIVSEKIGDKIYVMGGADYLKDGIMNVIEIYDPASNNGVNPLLYQSKSTTPPWFHTIVNCILLEDF